MDICAALKEQFTIHPGSIEIIPTNFSVEIPYEYELQVRPRSGLAAKYGIGILNSPGTIDSDYRGEVKIILVNLGKKNFIIKPADRIAQVVLSKIYRAIPIESKELNKTIRGEGGFGHTGK
jgi:dUTP pyrophosphatase